MSIDPYFKLLGADTFLDLIIYSESAACMQQNMKIYLLFSIAASHVFFSHVISARHLIQFWQNISTSFFLKLFFDWMYIDHVAKFSFTLLAPQHISMNS